MQIGSSTFYNTSVRQMTSLNDRATTLQTQISTGKKSQAPSDDPVAAQQSAELDKQDADAAVYKNNLTLAASRLSQTDTALGSITTQMQRATELVTQAGNQTLSTSDRKAIGDELSSLVDTMVGLVNGSDANGQPLFGTNKGTAAVTRNADGSFTYGATNVSPVPIADGQTVQSTESASRVFTVGGTDTLKMLSDLAAGYQAGTATGDDTSNALDKLTDASEQVSSVRSSVGARAARVDLQQTLQDTASTDRATLRSQVEDVDVTTAIAELQKTMTVLSATQASFTKLSSLSLFDYLK